MLVSFGHRVKVHKITRAVGNEHGDIEIKDYVVLPRGQSNCLPPCLLILNFTMTHGRYGMSNQNAPHGKARPRSLAFLLLQ
jgi:hypothetical protein